MYIGIENDGAITIGSKKNNPFSADRTEKGNSLLCFPDDYVLIDLETTGYSPRYDEIIELAAYRVRNGTIVDTFSSLVNLNGSIVLNDFIIEKTGITQEMVDSAPDITEVFEDYLRFIGSDIIVGHNVNFDVNFIYDRSMLYFEKPLTNDFIDTMRFFKRLHPEFDHHRLMDLAELYGVSYIGAHRAGVDCNITKQCFDALRDNISEKYGNIDSFLDHLKKRSYKCKPSTRAKDIVATSDDIDDTNMLFGKVCVFTGTLEKMTRKEAMQIVANLGGINADSVTKKTNYLILGCNDYCKSIKDGKSSKQKKAEKLLLDGFDISVISEDVFYEIIEGN